MAAVTIRNLPDEIHRALKMRAATHGLSTEAEIRAILEQAVTSKPPALFGSKLRALGQQLQGVDLNVGRSSTPVEIATFE